MMNTINKWFVGIEFDAYKNILQLRISSESLGF